LPARVAGGVPVKRRRRPRTIPLSKALRLEAKGLGRVFFEGGKGIWCPLELRP